MKGLLFLYVHAGANPLLGQSGFCHWRIFSHCFWLTEIARKKFDRFLSAFEFSDNFKQKVVGKIPYNVNFPTYDKANKFWHSIHYPLWNISIVISICLVKFSTPAVRYTMTDNSQRIYTRYWKFETCRNIRNLILHTLRNGKQSLPVWDRRNGNHARLAP